MGKNLTRKIANKNYELTLRTWAPTQAVSLVASKGPTIVASKITFEGDGPFHLPVAQQATAQGHLNNGVTITFKALLGERQKTHGLEAIDVQLVTTEARKLRDALSRAIWESEKAMVPDFFPPSLLGTTNARDR